MKLVTISREFGSGGRELGKRLADILEFDYYDGEILAAVAEKMKEDKDYIENALGEHGWRKYPLTYRGSIGSSAYIQASRLEELLNQRKALEKIAALGKDCLIVGRNADVILRDYAPFKIFVCADMDAKLKRCIERATQSEQLSEKELRRKIKQIDKMRAETCELLSNSKWGQRDAYNLIINTGGWDIKRLSVAVAELTKAYFE